MSKPIRVAGHIYHEKPGSKVVWYAQPVEVEIRDDKMFWISTKKELAFKDANGNWINTSAKNLLNENVRMVLEGEKFDAAR